VKIILSFFLTTSIFQATMASDPIRILAWNIESGGSDTQVIIEQLQADDMPDFDIVALSEVPSNAIGQIAKSLGWSYHGGSRGGEDRLMIAWSPRFESIEQIELRKVGDTEMPAGNNRAPILNRFRDRKTGIEFIVMNNHLTRGKEENRNLQAKLLVEWARQLKLPAIAVGDYNLDFDFHTRKGNVAFDLIQRDNVWKWIEPKELIDTNWSDPDGDGKDNYPDSMLDFAFVAGPRNGWTVKSEVVVRPGDFPDDDKTSDHRPVLTNLIRAR
jgi:endonuclease/exonuclease/phosphatase family metal-dependent hydrolase